MRRPNGVVFPNGPNSMLQFGSATVWCVPFASGANDESSLIDGCIAQLVEQLTLNQRVVGSNPTTPTMGPKGFRLIDTAAELQKIDPGHT